MKRERHRILRATISIRILNILAGMILNITLSFLAFHYDLPIYIDTVGTISVTALGGLLYGATAAFVSNLCGSFYDRGHLYFGLINVLVAIYTAFFLKKHTLRKPKDFLHYVLVAGTFSGALGMLIEYRLFQAPIHLSIRIIMQFLMDSLNTSYFFSFLYTKVLLAIFDKAISLCIVLLLLHFIPATLQNDIENSIWGQTPLSQAEINEISNWEQDIPLPSRIRMILNLVGMAILLIFIGSWIGVTLYNKTELEERTRIAENAVTFVEDEIDISKIDDYLNNGRSSEDYVKTETMLRKICNNSYGIDSLSLLRFSSDHVAFIFDIKKDSFVPAHSPGEIEDISDEYLPYLSSFLEGATIEPVETSGSRGKLLNVYRPLKTDAGTSSCYVVAEVSLTYMSSFVWDFVDKAALILSASFLLIIIYGVHMTNINVSFPISSLARCMDRFSTDGYEPSSWNQNIKALQNLHIHTKDEVEKLYHTLCTLTLDQYEQIRHVKRLSEEARDMQNGLIVIMANMAEKNDTFSRSHLEQSAAFVKVIAEGLHRKGYYTRKINETFIEDIVRNAPLHDIGKIRIPEAILKKSESRSKEEEEVFKTHTLEGKNVIEIAIETVHGESYLKEARNMAAYHHEHWDGTGYPEGLSGEVIPLSARIMALADTLDRLTAPDTNRKNLSLEEAFQSIEERSGTEFDPKCVEALLEARPEVEVIVRKYSRMR